MDFKKFVMTTKEEVQKLVGDEADVTIKSVNKNNNLKLVGLTIHKNSENISPTIYLNDFYEDYLHGQSIDAISQEILKINQDNRINNNNINVDFFTDFSNVEGKIVYKLVNYEYNKELLEDVPHKKYLDLAIVFYCLLKSGPLGNATILIHNNHLDVWEVDAETLYQKACKNSAKLLPVRINTMEEILKEELGISDLGEMGLVDNNPDIIPMYIISNTDKINGAACILYNDVLKDFAEAMKSDLYALPSSIHDIIVVPKMNSQIPSDLKQIIAETNDNHVLKEEILSYSLYEFCREENELRVVS